MPITSAQVHTYARTLRCISSNAAMRWPSFDDGGELRGTLRHVVGRPGSTARLGPSGDLVTAWVHITRSQAQEADQVWVRFIELVRAAQDGEVTITGYA
jgi:hypothetical protein